MPGMRRPSSLARARSPSAWPGQSIPCPSSLDAGNLYTIRYVYGCVAKLPEASSPDRILKSALELFSSKGYEAASVREICEASGLTKPTLYHFYGSKEGVYRALVDGALDGFRARVEADLGEP